jgi:hypothetical protein
MNDDATSPSGTDNDEELTRVPAPGQLPSDTDVQAERQDAGVDAEYEAAAREAVRGSNDESGDIGDGAD